MSDVETMLRLLKSPDFDTIVYKAVEMAAGITGKQSVVCNFDVVHDQKSLKEALLNQVWKNIRYDCAGEKFFLDRGLDFCGFTLSGELAKKAIPFVDPNSGENEGVNDVKNDKYKGRLCIERNDVYRFIKQTAFELLGESDEDEGDEEEEEEEEQQQQEQEQEKEENSRTKRIKL